MIQVLTTRQGWECPKCERVYSPDTVMCFYCKKADFVTGTSGVTITAPCVHGHYFGCPQCHTGLTVTYSQTDAETTQCQHGYDKVRCLCPDCTSVVTVY
jgi:hypothetical protein